MKGISLAILLTLSSVSLVFSKEIKKEKPFKFKKVAETETINLLNLKDFEAEADYQLLRLSMELEKDLNNNYTEK